MASPQHPLLTAGLTDFVQVGVVSGTHGHDGRLRVQVETDNPARFRPGADIWIGGRAYRVQRTEGTGDIVLVKLAGIETKEEAAIFVHQPVTVPASALPCLPEGSYYHYHLIGMQVWTEGGEVLGSLTEVINTGANDVYVVTRDRQELLVPAVADVVKNVNLEIGRMTVDLPEGLEWRQLKPPGQKPARPQRRRRRHKQPPDARPANG